MAQGNKLEKEFVRLLKKNFLPTNYIKYFTQTLLKFNYICIFNVASLINKSNSQKLNNKQHIEFSRCNFIDKADYPLKYKRQYEWVYIRLGYIDANIMIILIITEVKVYIGSTQRAFKKDITTIEIVLHMKYSCTGRIYLCVVNQNKTRCRSCIKIEENETMP